MNLKEYDMLTEEEIKILIEIVNSYKQEQLNLLVIKQRALEWWQPLREDCIGHSDALAKNNLAYKYHKCYHNRLTEQQIIDIWKIHAVKR